MITAYSPGHITCFFRPVRTDDVMTTGSEGAGIRIEEGAFVSVSENRTGVIDVIMDGNPADAPVTRKLIDLALPGRGFDVTVENQLPTSQGFGMSAAGAIALALCLSEIGDFSVQEAYRYAHAAEVLAGGGLGDVSAIVSDLAQPVRTRAGLPPEGKVEMFCDLPKAMTASVLGEKVHTGTILSDPEYSKRLSVAGKKAMDDFFRKKNKQTLFKASNTFSKELGLMSDEMVGTVEQLRKHGIQSGMCMLGNSIFMDAPLSKVEDILEHPLYTITPTSRKAGIIRKE